MNQEKPAGAGPVADPFRGVVFTSSDQISATLKRQVQQELDRVGDKRAVMARVDVTVTGPDGAKSVNAVLAYQSAGGWQAATWAGKSGWDKVAGVSVGKVWK